MTGNRKKTAAQTWTLQILTISSPSTLHPRDSSSLTYKHGSQQTANLFCKQTDFYSLGKKTTNKFTVYYISFPIPCRSKQATFGIWVGFLLCSLDDTSANHQLFQGKAMHLSSFPWRRIEELNLLFETPGELQFRTAFTSILVSGNIRKEQGKVCE